MTARVSRGGMYAWPEMSGDVQVRCPAGLCCLPTVKLLLVGGKWLKGSVYMKPKPHL